MKTPALKTIGSLLLAGSLAACGGGGSDAGLSLTTPYAIATAYRNTLGSARDVTLSGTGSDKNPYTVRIVLQPIGSASFPVGNVAATRTRQTLTLTNTTTKAASSTTVDYYYDAATATPLGSVDTSGACTKITAFKALPAAGTIGAGDALSTEADLASCASSAAITLSVNSTWSLETPAGSGIALLCENATVPATSSAPTSLISLCTEINADGSLGSRMRFYTKISTLPLFELNATNY